MSLMAAHYVSFSRISCIQQKLHHLPPLDPDGGPVPVVADAPPSFHSFRPPMRVGMPRQVEQV